MSYVVLARKWRPMSFADLIGQEHVCRTLSNAIATNRVAHAFLFTGVRGVGKTTSARIVAKALNCLGDPDLPSVSEGPPPEPCLKCAACTEIAAGIDLDVREIDAASYNGVEEVRKLQDSLPYRPTRDRYKIFIVDEVHMLSQSAWNAFLKTLEEPPAHVKFIFATTEVHKVPVTILSRVQRFDFKLISPAQIGERLRYVLEQEKIETDDASISIIARQAAGSMRDAMSLLDQVIAYDSQRLRADEVARLLGVASHEVLHRLAKHVLDGETVEALRLIAELAVQGFDIPIVCRDLLEAFRDCVIARVTPATAGSILELGVEHHKWLSEQTKQHTVDDLLRVHHGFSASYDEVVRSSQPRTALEMLLVRLSRRPPLIPIDDLIQRLEALEQRTRGKPPDAPGGTRSSSSSSGQGRRGTTREASAGPREQPPRSQAEPAWPAAAQASSAQALAVTGPGSAQPEADTTGAGASSGAPSRNSSRTTPGIMPVSIDNKPSPPRPPAAMLGHAPLMAELGGSSQPAATSLVAPFLPLAIGAAAALAPSVGVELRRSLDDLEQDTPVDKHVADAHACWRSIIATLQGRHPEVAAFFSHGHPVRLDATSIVLAFERGSVLATTAQRTENVNALAEAASSHLGQLPNISFSVLEDDQHETLAQQNKRERIQLEQKLKLEARSHPAVKQVEQLLGARVVEIRLPRH